MKNKLIALAATLTIGIAMPAYAVDACNDEMGHQGDKRTIQNSGIETVKSGNDASALDYEVWLQDGNGSMTYWNNGTFSAEWSGSNDFIVRVGRKYSDAMTYDKYEDFSADFKFAKSGSAGYSYIGVYGRTENPAVEYYIVEDWFVKPSEEYLGTKIGEYELDGDTYELWQERRNTKPTIQGDMSFLQVISVRRNARQCGRINITAHFKKWDTLGVRLGKLDEMKMLVEAGGESTGKIDFTYFNINDSSPRSIGGTNALRVPPKRFFKSGYFQVFDMQGRYLGMVELTHGSSLKDAVATQFQQSGKFLVKWGNAAKIVTIENYMSVQKEVLWLKTNPRKNRFPN